MYDIACTLKKHLEVSTCFTVTFSGTIQIDDISDCHSISEAIMPQKAHNRSGRRSNVFLLVHVAAIGTAKQLAAVLHISH